jgi:hypothetical protein
MIGPRSELKGKECGCAPGRLLYILLPREEQLQPLASSGSISCAVLLMLMFLVSTGKFDLPHPKGDDLLFLQGSLYSN